MDRLREMELFVSVIEAGSFVDGGRRLGVSPPAVTRAVSSLEERLGVRLINRTTRSLRLTEAGERYLQSCRQFLSDLEGIESAVTGASAEPSGRLTVTAPVTFGRLALAPLIGGLLDDYPKLQVNLVLVDRVTNLIEEGLDVGVRIGQLPDSSLIARRLGEVRRCLVASPGYLAAQGTPRAPKDLMSHRVIVAAGLMDGREVRLLADGKPVSAKVARNYDVNDVAAAIAAAEAGCGVTIALSYMVGEALRMGRLKPVLKPYWQAPVPVQIVYPHSRLLATKVRVFVDWAAPRLSDKLRELSRDAITDVGRL